MVKILITGDNHLNLYNQKLGAKLTERRARIGQAWWKTIEYAIENKVDLYIHTGDLFDQLSPRNPPRARTDNPGAHTKEYRGTHCGVDGKTVAGYREFGVRNVPHLGEIAAGAY